MGIGARLTAVMLATAGTLGCVGVAASAKVEQFKFDYAGVGQFEDHSKVDDEADG